MLSLTGSSTVCPRRMRSSSLSSSNEAGGWADVQFSASCTSATWMMDRHTGRKKKKRQPAAWERCVVWVRTLGLQEATDSLSAWMESSRSRYGESD